MREPDGKPENSQDEDFDDQANENIEPDGEATITTDNVGETSVEIDINELMAEMEAEGVPTEHLTEARNRKRIDELLEQRRIERELQELESFEID